MPDNRDHQRPKSHPLGVPTEVPDEITGQYEGDDLDAIRARRPTRLRIDSLERRSSALEREVSKMSGQMDGQDKVLANIQKSIDNLSAREHVTFTAQVDVAKHKAIDVVDAGRARREWVTQVLKILGAAVALAAAAFAAGRC